MRKYPMNSGKKGYIAIEEAEKIANAAYYDGFITAILETPEEADELTPVQRIQCAELAILKNAILTRSTPPPRAGRTKRRFAAFVCGMEIAA